MLYRNEAFNGKLTSMYRCYLLRAGRIVKADNLDVATLEQAIIAGRSMLADQPMDKSFSGFEIWHGTAMLHAEATGGAEAAEAVADGHSARG